ncbi:MAG: hypothetical protein ACI4XF_04460 [Oscillospiraceae bacterium]
MITDDLIMIDNIMRLRKCIACGTERDFTDIAGKLLSKTGGIAAPLFGFECYLIRQAGTMLIPEFITAFAEKYPEGFLKCDCSAFADHVRTAAVREIIAKSQTAYTLADKMISLPDEEVFFSDIAKAAVLCGNDSFFDYFVGRTERPSACIGCDLVYYLFDNHRYHCLDMIFEGASREDIITPRPNQLTTVKWLECYYELGIRYLPEIKNSADVPGAASEFLREVGISDFLSCSPSASGNDSCYTAVWDFMKEHGLKFIDISYLVISYAENVRKDRDGCEAVLKSRILPLLADEVYIDVLSASGTGGSDQRMFSEAVRLIGADRIYLDLTDRHIPKMEEWKLERDSVKELHLSFLLRMGLRVRIDDDISHSKLIRPLLRSSSVLDHVLQNAEISDEQLDALVDMCIENKYFKALNIIRKFMAAKKEKEEQL